jgi:hypothetical protein
VELLRSPVGLLGLGASISSPYVTSLYGAWVSGTGFLAEPDDVPRCSAKGCRAAAVEDLHWRNPSLHDAARVKHWLACAEHGDQLADFLNRRGFLLAREPFG